MKKNYFILTLLFVALSSIAQIQVTTYRGAFAPAPAAAWTDGWANFDPINTVYPLPTASNVVNVTSNITTNTTWSAANVYYLKAQIYVQNNATLTIPAGTIILNDHTAVGAGLFITKGAKLFANGTAASPIVFTSDYPAGAGNGRAPGNWGGIVLLGKASYNINGGVNNIEGIPATADTQYGGGTTPDDNDNSGSLQYVRIEFAGYVYQPNQEINGLTFGAIGRATTIDNVQVSFSNDDSYEWFGGTVNCKRLIAYRGTDDDFDTDNGYKGSVQFILGIKDPQIGDATYAAASGASTSEGFESDNNSTSSAATPVTSAIFTNCTLVGPAFRNTLPNANSQTIYAAHRRAARIRRNSQLKIFNSLFMDFKEGLFIDGSTTEANAYTTGTSKWKNNVLAGTAINNGIVPPATTGTLPLITTTVQTGYGSSSATQQTWYANNNNTTLSSNANILTSPYNTSDAQVYNTADYRPTSTSIIATGADFTDADLAAATLSNNSIVNPEISTSVYPNPFNDNFKIGFASNSSDDIRVSVYDLTGKMVETTTISVSNINGYELGLNYNPGLFLVVVKQGETSKTFKVMKN